DLMAAGIVLTGGTSKMEGVVELAEEIFHMPVRVGAPQDIRGLTDIVNNPNYSTGVGLLLSGMQQHREGSRPHQRRGKEKVGFMDAVMARLRGLFQGNL